MVGKDRLRNALLCFGLAMMCVAGCGAAGSDNAARNADVQGDGSVEPGNGADKADATVAEEITADEEKGLDTQNASEASDADDAKYEDAWEGRSLSILGDSISTYDGWIPEECVVFYPNNGELTDISQTWWMQLLNDTGMELCANSSSSGSTCVGDSLDIDNPQYGCSGYRISLIAGKQGKMPDIIIVYMGTNDLLKGIPLGDNDGTQLVEEGMVENFSDAYTLILDQLESNYPMAQIYCCTLAPIGDWGTDRPFVIFENHLGLTSEDYSERIQIIADNKGIPVINLLHCGIEIDNLHEMTSDGVHFKPEGMEYIERAVLSGIGFTPND